MADLIDRDEVRRTLYMYIPGFRWKTIDMLVDGIPSAQPEQQIRCNECIYFDKYTDGIEKYQWDGFCSVWARNAYEEWYCSRAERRSDDKG